MDDYNRLRWIVAMMFPVLFLLAGRYRGRAHREGGPVSRRDEGLALMIGIRLAALAIFALLITWMIAPEAEALFPTSIPPSFRYAGAALAWIALALQWWVFASLGLNLTDTVVVRPNATLVRHGPYRWVRHPLYTVAVLLIAGLTLVTGSLAMLFAGVLWYAAIRMRTPIEEAKLIERFGEDYRAYMRETGGFLPRVRTGRPR